MGNVVGPLFIFLNIIIAGTIAFDNGSGFWLVHSVPKFPDFAKNRYVWPHNALYFGQSMLCISMKTDEFVKVGKYQAIL